MPDLTFKVLGVRAELSALVPMLIFRLQATNPTKNEQISSVLLKCQINLEAHLRLYNQEEQEKLYEIFGQPLQWMQSLRSFLWTHVTTLIPAFVENVEFDVPVPCTYDFEIASTKYFRAIKEGSVPIVFLFNGTIFYRTKEKEDEALQISPIPWDREASFQLPIPIWKQAIENSFPNSAWLRVQNETLQKLNEYKSRNSLPTLDEALNQLIENDSEKAIEPA